MHQEFATRPLSINETYIFDKDMKHHIFNVLRMKENDRIRIVDSLNRPFIGIIDGNHDLLITKALDGDSELSIRVKACIALIKPDKLATSLQKLTELGVSEIVVFSSSRTVYKTDESKLERYRKILKEAAKQSNRNIIPSISLSSLDKLIDHKCDNNFLAYEKEGSNKIDYSALRGDICFVIGPEGGFSEKEADYLIENGFSPVSLGKRILRAETAALYMMSCIGEFYG